MFGHLFFYVRVSVGTSPDILSFIVALLIILGEQLSFVQNYFITALSNIL